MEINGAKYSVAFSRHALERYCERSVYNWQTYGGMGDAFGVISGTMTKYLPAVIHHKSGATQQAVAIYNQCAHGHYNAYYAKEVLGEEYSKTKRYYYLAGYCAVELSGNFAQVKTLLAPGMRGTPEDVALRSANLPKDEFFEIQNSFKATESFRGLVDSNDFTAVKWAHDHGVPQVING